MAYKSNCRSWARRPDANRQPYAAQSASAETTHKPFGLSVEYGRYPSFRPAGEGGKPAEQRQLAIEHITLSAHICIYYHAPSQVYSTQSGGMPLLGIREAPLDIDVGSAYAKFGCICWGRVPRQSCMAVRDTHDRHGRPQAGHAQQADREGPCEDE